MNVTLVRTVLSLFILEFSYQMINDFWDHDFDEDHNCDDVLLLEYSKTNQVRCALVGNGTRDVQFEECKKKLASNLISSCPHTKVKVKFIVAKRLTYCSYSC